MSTKTAIQWTDRTWNPVRGCSIVSPGCTNCYAMKQAHRFSGAGKPYEGLTRLTSKGPIWTGKIRLVPEALDEPLHWKQPSRVFVNSMSDLFHEDVPDAFIDEVFAVMALTPDHTYQILTKRPERMRTYACELAKGWRRVSEAARTQKLPEPWRVIDALAPKGRSFQPLSNAHLGVSVENQEQADARIPLLLQTPAAVRFLSVEPLLEVVDLKLDGIEGPDYEAVQYGHTPYFLHNVELGHPCDYACGGVPVLGKVDWVIVGGESGPNARPCNIEWIRSIVRQCKAAGVPCFVKQVGSRPFDPECNHPSSGGVLSRAEQEKLGYTPYFCGMCFEEPHPNQLRECRGGGLIGLRDRKGGDPSEWPEDLRVREFPR